MALRSAASGIAASRVRVALVVLLTLLLLHLAFGDRPWDPALSLRFASGQPRAKDYAARFEWWASLINAALAAALLATRRHWLGREAPPELPSLARPAPPTRWQLGLVALAALVLAAHALPRLGQGLWDDEERTARNAVAGFYEADPSGRLHFHGASWRDTLWRYDPNDHVAYSVLARVSTGVWAALTDSPDRRAPEAALRIPAFVFGLGSLAAVFGLLWRLGYARAGVVSAWILALHPWAIRYASEARGYSLEMMLAPAAAALLVEALHGGRWRSWLLLAGAEALMLWTYPPALLHLGLLNLAALAALLGLRGGTPALRPQLARWLVASLVAGMLLLQVALPDVPQLLAYLHEQHRRIDGRFLADLLSYFFSGEAWSWRARSSAQFPELARLAAARPFALWASVAATLLALALGALRLLRAPAAAPRPAARAAAGCAPRRRRGLAPGRRALRVARLPVAAPPRVPRRAGSRVARRGARASRRPGASCGARDPRPLPGRLRGLDRGAAGGAPRASPRAHARVRRRHAAPGPAGSRAAGGAHGVVLGRALLL